MENLRRHPEALAMVAHAKVLSGNKLEQLVVRLQRRFGESKDACWRFVIRHGIATKIDHRPWTENEIETLREELVKRPLAEVAKKLNRTPDAIRSILKRNNLSLRDIRCDLFSVESLARALRIGRGEVLFWIEQKWLPASLSSRGKKRFYVITPEALTFLYKKHLHDLLKRGLPSQSLFEAFLEYCYSPKHTTGEQLLDVRRDKRERAAFVRSHNKEDSTNHPGNATDEMDEGVEPHH